METPIGCEWHYEETTGILCGQAGEPLVKCGSCAHEYSEARLREYNRRVRYGQLGIPQPEKPTPHDAGYYTAIWDRGPDPEPEGKKPPEGPLLTRDDYHHIVMAPTDSYSANNGRETDRLVDRLNAAYAEKDKARRSKQAPYLSPEDLESVAALLDAKAREPARGYVNGALMMGGTELHLRTIAAELRRLAKEQRP